ncbi:fucose permease [Anaerolinea thermolimosa]|uniref:MFS transporter n=1 Tax=Anaerolinea thermolimosa TaxID=229919 RepID=UPI000784D564|nr:MFS transporter [Anaerolinea thermolimosa]GAP06480.1 fucose permease [Anaerolinea thermolimosa]
MNELKPKALETRSGFMIIKTLIYYAAFIALGLTTASLGPTLPGLAETTRTDISRISFLFVMRSLGYLLGSINAGRLYDKKPGNPVMGLALFLAGALLMAVPLIPYLWLLAIVILLVGFTEGTVDVGGNTLLVWLHQDRVGPYMNGLHFTFGIGALLSPVIVAQAISLSGSYRWAYWVLGLIMLPIAAWIVRVPSPQFQKDESRPLESRTNTYLLALLVMFFFLYVGAESSFGGWVYTYTINMGLGTETSAAYLTSLFWGALTIGRLLAIPIASRLRPGVMLGIDLAGCLLSLGIINLFSYSPTALIIGTIGTGIFMASIFPTLINLAQQKMQITGKITSWFFVGASSGGMFLPWIIGQLFIPVGPRITMLAILISLLVSTVIFILVLRNNRKTSSRSLNQPG